MAHPKHSGILIEEVMMSYEGTGITTKAIKSCKLGAMYVCSNWREAERLRRVWRKERPDIRFVTVEDLSSDKLMGIDLLEIKVDHSVTLTGRAYQMLMILKSRIQLQGSQK